jgi:chromosomal replication initiator protein
MKQANPLQIAPVAQPWDGFLVGPENRLAHASILALARGESAGVSPLVVHGGAGVGKSRLLSGLVGETLARRPGAAAARLEAEAFAASCAEASGRSGGWAELRGWFRALDLFVLEDLHALERAPLALAELSHTLDALFEAGAAVAVSARVGPGQWKGWPARLVNRLMGGLSVRVDPPGLESRRRFLLDHARSRGIAVAAGAVDALAEAADGYRTLEGWLARLTLTAKVERRPIDRALALAIMADDGISGENPKNLANVNLSIEEITRVVAKTFGVHMKDMRSASRRQSAAEPRHMAMRLTRDLTGLSFQAIGRYFGGRDPATVRHACKAAALRESADPALGAAVAAIRRRWVTETLDE